MRLLAAVLFLAFAASPAVAADKDEDKAKEAAAAFLKALKARDLDAVMKTVDVPFLMEDKEEPITKLDDLKTTIKPLVEKAKPEKLPDAVSGVLDLAAVKKKAEGKKGNEKVFASIEKVLGKTGFVVVMTKGGKERGAILVRVKDGQAKVVGIAD